MTTPIVAVFAPLPDALTIGPLSRCMLNFHVMPEFASELMQRATEATEQFVSMTRDVGSDGTPYTNDDGTITVFHYEQLNVADSKAILLALRPQVSVTENNIRVYRKFGLNLNTSQEGYLDATAPLRVTAGG